MFWFLVDAEKAKLRQQSDVNDLSIMSLNTTVFITIIDWATYFKGEQRIKNKKNPQTSNKRRDTFLSSFTAHCKSNRSTLVTINDTSGLVTQTCPLLLKRFPAKHTGRG